LYASCEQLTASIRKSLVRELGLSVRDKVLPHDRPSFRVAQDHEDQLCPQEEAAAREVRGVQEEVMSAPRDLPARPVRVQATALVPHSQNKSGNGTLKRP
jgi:hypothetical protein